MPEILTESFCERCGTRYTFESASPRGARLKGIKVMSRGLRNFVMSDDTSMDEAMAAARNETDREQTAQQLDAFHQTFNFCMSCRQYTCGNCWNEAEGRCLSCSPHLGHEILPAPFSNVGAGGAVTLTGPEAIGLHDRNGHEAAAPAPAEPMAWPAPEPMAWPSSDLMREDAQPEPPQSFQDVIDAVEHQEPVAEPAADVVETVEAQTTEAEEVEEPAAAATFEEVVASEAPDLTEAPEEALPPIDLATRFAGADPQVAPVAEAPVSEAPAAAADRADTVTDAAAAAATKTTDLLERFRPGQNLDDEIAAYERETQAAGAAMAAAAEVIAAEADLEEAADRADAAELAAREAAAAALEPEPDAAPEAELVVPAPEPMAAMPEPAAPMPEPEPVAAETREDLVVQPTWQIVAPEPPSTTPTAPPVVPPAIPTAPTAPTTSTIAAVPPAESIAATAEPQWPTQPTWPPSPSAEGLPFFGRPPAGTGGIEALWAESAREVSTVPPAVGSGTRPGGVQPCVSCGLSLSANARFCRRCGTRQG